MERKEKPFASRIVLELVTLPQELLHRLVWTRAELWKHGVAIQVRILDDHVTSETDVPPIRTHFREDMGLAVVRIETDHRAVSAGGSLDFFQNVLGQRGADMVRDARVYGSGRIRFDVDGDYPSVSKQVTQMCEIESAPPMSGAAFHDDVRSCRENDLLIDPKIEGVLQDSGPHPIGIVPGGLGATVEEFMEVSDDLVCRQLLLGFTQVASETGCDRPRHERFDSPHHCALPPEAA